MTGPSAFSAGHSTVGTSEAMGSADQFIDAALRGLEMLNRRPDLLAIEV